jgi:uncharacterized radical SAM superfamily Fe-S cluster-containing enzyme
VDHPERAYRFYDVAVSLCATCLRRVDAKIVFEDGAVWMLKRCPQHGAERVLIADDIEYYRRAREVFLKAPEQVRHYNTRVRYGCPYDCGVCPDHEQHGCTLLIEVTDACNLRCPTCYAASGPERQAHRPLEQIVRMLDLAVRNEGEPDVVQISGGEPTLHPRFFDILDEAAKRPIQHLMVNTNGVRIANDAAFVRRLLDYGPDFEVYLQFDSLRARPLEILRGEDLRHVRRRALDRLNELDISTTLVVTVRRGVNDDELGEILEYARRQPCVRGVTLQPVQAAGRLEGYAGGYDPGRDRLTLTEVRRRVLERCDLFAPEDVIPVPCHADNVAMAYAIRRGESFVPLTGLVPTDLLLEVGRNTMSYEADPKLREGVFRLFSTHHSLRSRADAARRLAQDAGGSLQDLGYRDLFRLLILEFIDAHAFDLRSIRKSCVHIVHPDAERIVPFDTYNLLYRDHLEREILDPLRAEVDPGHTLAPMLVPLRPRRR